MSIRRVALGLLGLTLASSAIAQTGGPWAVVVLSDESGQAPALGTLHALQQLTIQRLRADGVQVLDVPAFQSPQALDNSLGEKVRATGATRLFVLHVFELGSKFIEQLDERDLNGQTVVATATLTGTLEESDVMVARLVDAVLHRESATDTAHVSNLTTGESEPYKKRPGEHHFVLGLPIGLTNAGASGALGLSLGYLYETEDWGLGFSALGAGNSNGAVWLLEMYGLYYFLPGNVSPYLGGGLGFMAVADNSNSSGSGGNGLGLTAELGVELLRLNHTHLQMGIQGLFPLYTNPGASTYDPASGAYVTHGNRYLPAVLLYFRIPF
jgi:hypothetical protein